MEEVSTAILGEIDKRRVGANFALSYFILENNRRNK